MSDLLTDRAQVMNVLGEELTAVITFKPCDDRRAAIPTLFVRGLRLDGLSRQRLLVETEKHLRAALGVDLVAEMESDPTRDDPPVVKAYDGDTVVAVGSVKVSAASRSHLSS